MKFLIQYIIVLVFINNVFTNVIYAQQKVDSLLNVFINHKSLKNASMSFLAIDLNTNDTIGKYNSEKVMTCASTTKLFSTASALEILNPNFAPKTEIYYSGTINKDSVLLGDIWIKGDADISLGSMYFQDSITSLFENWKKSIKKLGINKINGRIIGDASLFGYSGVPEDWTWADIGNYYGSFPNGLPIYDNILRYHFKTSNSPKIRSELIKTTPSQPELTFSNNIFSAKISGDKSYIYGSPFDYKRSGSGLLPINRDNFVVKGSLPDPEITFAREFHNFLIYDSTFSISKPATGYRLVKDSLENKYENFHLVNEYVGKNVQEIAYWTNLKSVNVFAETLVTWIAKNQKTDDYNVPNGINIINEYWKDKIDLNGIALKDGSGLSRSNTISSGHFVNLLKYMYHESKYSKEFYETLPIAGVSGTLTSVCKNQPAHGKLKAKSGTMSRVKSYAGYIETNLGNTVAFAIIVNNYNCSAGEVLRLMEPIFNEIVLYK